MNLKCFDKVIVERPKVDGQRITTNYVLEYNSRRESCELKNKYESNIEGDNAQRHANLMAGIVAVNYGLFADEIIFDYELSPAEKSFFEGMVGRVGREIFAYEFLLNPVCIKEQYLPKEGTNLEDMLKIAKFSVGVDNSLHEIFETDPEKAIILSSGGKESLLSYGILKEAGLKVYPVFMNESGGHWKTALTAYRYFVQHVPETSRVWTNMDHLFIFLVKNMEIVKDEIRHRKGNKATSKRAIVDPINIFSYPYYVFSALPLVEKHGIGNICIGNEYDDPSKIISGNNRVRGIQYFPAVFDQSQEFSSYMDKWFKEAGFKIDYFSAIRPIMGFLVEKILAERYPELLKLQVSCHHTHMSDGKVLPCGECAKCVRILSFCAANDIDHKLLGYSDEDAKNLKHKIKSLKLDKDELEHTYYKLWEKGFDVSGIWHRHVEQLHFDDISSPFENIPENLRERIYPILLSSSRGAAKMDSNNRWVNFDLEEAIRK